MQYYINRNGQQLGPFTEAEVRAQLAAGTIALQDHVWWEGQADWIQLGQSPLAAANVPAKPGAPVVVPPIGTVQPTSKLAIWALVCGCLSLVCNIFTAIPAIILGHMGMAETKKDPTIPGRGLALAGLIIGYVITGLTIAYFILIFVVFATMGDQLKDVFKTINSQLNAQQAAANADQATNAPDQNTPTATPTPTPDQSSNSATTTPTTPDQSTNSASPSTNAPPVNQ